MRGPLPALRLAQGAAVALCVALPFALTAGHQDPRPATPHAAMSAASLNPPLAFEPNAGRYGADVRFLTRRGGYALGLMADGSTVLSTDDGRVRTRLVGARRDAAVTPESRLRGVVNSFIGNDRSRWRTGLPTYGAIRYRDVYPGIDLRYHGRQGQLEYDYIVQSGADARRIAMAIGGRRVPRLTRGGDLVIPTAAGTLRQRRPIAYQEIGGTRVRVRAAFHLDGRHVSFRLGDYDKSRPLVIDPQLIFSTYIGGTSSDTASDGELVTTNGDTYLVVAGNTRSPQFHGSNLNANGDNVHDDVWLSRMTTDGSDILVTTFIGGAGNDTMSAMTFGTGRLFLTGATEGNMPVGANLSTPFKATYAAGDSWLARIDPSDLTPEVITYYPGPAGVQIAYTNFTVVLANSTTTTTFPTSTGPAAAGGTDVYVASFSANLANRNWARYLGGPQEDVVRAVTVDENSNVLLGGYSYSPSASPLGFPVTTGSGNGSGNLDGFLSKLSADGTTLTFSRLYGGTDYDIVNSIWAGHLSGTQVFVGGETASSTLPGIAGSAPSPGFNGYVTKVSVIDSSTFGGFFVGGSGSDAVTDVGFDGFGEIYALGITASTDFPTVNPVQSQNAGGDDVFLTKTFSGQTIFSTYLGGAGNESLGDLVIDPSDNNAAHIPGALRAYIVGTTGSTDLAATAVPSENASTPVQPDAAGNGDGFVARIQPLSAKITGGPAEGSTAASRTANFTLGPAPEAGAHFECSLDGDTYAACTAPSFAGLADGAHTLRARYHDPGDLTDGTVATRRWTVDATPPLTFALQSPADGAVVVSKPTFTWDTTTDALSMPLTYALWVDGAPRSEDPDCGGGVCSVTLATALGDGAHPWEVRATDAVGNVRQSATRTANVDAAGPSAATLSGPVEGAELATDKPKLEWSASTDAGSGVAGYDVELDGTALELHLSASTLTYTPPSGLGEGTHNWRVIATDQFGNTTKSALGHFRVDLTPPNAQLSVSPNPVLAGRAVTLDAGSSNDAAGGKIVHYEWDLDGDGTYELNGGTTPTTTKTFNASGSYLMAVRVTDTVGQMRAASSTLIVTTPPIPIGQLGVTIDNGAQYTRTPDVTLFLNFPTTTSQFLVSNDGGFLKPTTFTPKKEIAWKLDSSGPERLPKTVYIRFLFGPIVSETYTDDIILDETPPVVEQASVTEAPDSTEAASAATLKKYTVKLKATDSNSGVNGIQITANKSKPGKFLKYRTKLTVRAATRKLYVRARDRAGNLSRWKKTR